MNNTIYGQMQMDVMNTANNMVIQQVCAERGIDYNMLMAQAQQQYINGIMAAAQQRMIMKEVKRHYQGDTFFGKMRDLFGGQSSADMMNPMMFPGFMPQPAMVQPMHSYMQPAAPMPAPEIPLPAPSNADARMDAIEEDVKKINGFLEELAARLMEGPQKG